MLSAYAKASSNFAKHGIRFETAAKIFADKNKLIRYDEEHPFEERYRGPIVHIISARLATEPEKAGYKHGEYYDE